MLQNVDEIVSQVKQMIEYYDLDINEARDVIAKNMVGEQSLPLKAENREIRDNNNAPAEIGMALEDVDTPALLHDLTLLNETSTVWPRPSKASQ